MYIKKMHILIEQKLQTIGVFAYSDFSPEEIDLQIDTAIIKLIEESFTSDGQNKTKFEDNQKNKDKFKELEVRNFPLTLIKEEDETVALLPDDYNHLISDTSLYLYRCSKRKIKSGEIIKDNYYIVEKGTLEYAGQTYIEGEYFKGDVNTQYSYISSIPPILYKLEVTKSSNRLVESEYYQELTSNSLTTSNEESLLSTISGKKLIIFSSKFFVDKVLLTYIKEANKANSKFKTYTAGTTLQVDSEYEIVKGSLVYNGQTITYEGFNKKLNSFKVVTGITTFTSADDAIVRLKGDGDIELNNTTCYYIIDEVANNLAILSEQNQQKIVNMKQNGIPS